MPSSASWRWGVPTSSLFSCPRSAQGLAAHSHVWALEGCGYSGRGYGVGVSHTIAVGQLAPHSFTCRRLKQYTIADLVREFRPVQTCECMVGNGLHHPKHVLGSGTLIRCQFPLTPHLLSSVTTSDVPAVCPHPLSSVPTSDVPAVCPATHSLLSPRVQSLVTNMDKYLQGVFTLASDSSAEVRKLVLAPHPPEARRGPGTLVDYM